MRARPVCYLLGVAVLGALYFAAAMLGLSLASSAEQVTLVWPPTGIALAAVLLFGPRVWPGIALGAFLANALAHEPLPVAAGIAAGNTLEALAGAWLLRRLVGFRPSLERARDVLGLIVLAATVSTAVSATVGVTSLCLGGVQPWAEYGALWWVWWLGDGMGALIVAPALLTWADRLAARRRPRRLAEACVLLLGLGVVSAAVFAGGPPAGRGYPLEYTVFPFVIAAALRFGQPGAAAVTLTVAAIAVWATMNGHGPFAKGTTHENLILLQLYMAVVAVTALLLGAITAERRTAGRRLAASHAVANVLAGSPTTADPTAKILQAICDSLGWDVGALWTVDAQADVLRCAEVWPRAPAAFPGFEVVSRGRTFARGVGLPGRVWASGRPAWIADILGDDNFPRAPAAAHEGLRGAFAFPVVVGNQTLGVVEFFSRSIQQPDDDLLRLLAAAGSQVGLFLERRRAEERLRESERNLRLIAENATDVIFAYDLARRLLYGNPAFEALTGYTVAELRERQFINYLHPEDAPRMLALMEGVFQGIPFRDAEFRIVTRGGEVKWCSSSWGALLDAAGKQIGVQGREHDITERRRAEQAFQEQHELLRVLTDNAASCLCLIDAGGRATYVNPAFEAVTGYTLEEIRGRLVHDVLHHRRPDGSPYPRADCPIDRATAAQRPLKDHEDVFLRKSGEFFPVRFWLVPLAGGGSAVGGVAEFRDVTVEKRAAEELAEADRRKDEFLAMLAHELRNPLAPIRNALHLLKFAGGDGVQLQQVRDLMERQVQHLVRLVDDLLDVSRIMRGKIELRKESLELATVVSRAVETVQPVIDAQGHRLEVALPPGPVRLHGDLVRLAQVLGNLLNNAAKYTERGGRIRLDAACEGGEVVVRVQDTGLGIPPGLLPHVFEPFVQGDGSMERSQGGLGIGLTLVRRLAELHGGSATAASAGPGRGSEFTVRLPIEDRGSRIEDRKTPPLDSRSSILDPRPPGRRILVVDDNVDAAESLALLLRGTGHEVRTAYNGPAALEAAQASPPEVVLLDLGLPGMTGYEVAARLRQDRYTRGVLLIALTGWGQEEDRRRTREAGFDHHLVKPVEPEVLQSLLASPA
jgi:PAS domain S-box-containing protein